MSTTRIRAVAVIAFALAAVVLPGAANAVPPPNDDFGSAIVIPSLPYANAQDTSEATWAPDDPDACHSNGSVWYAFTPSQDGVLEADTFGSGYDTTLAAYTGSQGSLSLVPGACNDDFSGLQSRISFQASAGTTYYILVGRCCGGGFGGGGSLVFRLQEVVPPPNDAFADARQVTAVPFWDSVEATAATVEPGEPTPSCGFGQSNGTVWYAFTPTESRSYSASAPFTSFWSQVAVYTGTQLTDLAEVGCRTFGQPVAFQAETGETYYIQIGGISGGSGTIALSLDVTLLPSVWFWYLPTEPTIYDTVSFSGSWFDPVGNPIVEQVFEFGDGATADGCCPQHRYAVDGDYTARLRVTTSDGRVGSYEQLISVRTHDVSVTRFAVPQTARVGQTRELTVGIRNTQYAENVTVEVFRSRIGGGFELVGSLTQVVPVRSANRTTSFPILYTFTEEDAVAGKVTFKAVAIVNSAVDAFPADNEALAPPTRVTS